MDWEWLSYLFRRCADENWRASQAVNEDRDKLLQKCWVYWTRNVVFKIIPQLCCCFNSDFDIWEMRLGLACIDRELFWQSFRGAYQNQQNLIAAQRDQ
jgi:hypothetical protein